MVQVVDSVDETQLLQFGDAKCLLQRIKLGSPPPARVEGCLDYRSRVGGREALHLESRL